MFGRKLNIKDLHLLSGLSLVGTSFNRFSSVNETSYSYSFRDEVSTNYQTSKFLSTTFYGIFFVQIRLNEL